MFGFLRGLSLGNLSQPYTILYLLAKLGLADSEGEFAMLENM
jgi:hypothetical protein